MSRADQQWAAVSFRRGSSGCLPTRTSATFPVADRPRGMVRLARSSVAPCQHGDAGRPPARASTADGGAARGSRAHVGGRACARRWRGCRSASGVFSSLRLDWWTPVMHDDQPRIQMLGHYGLGSTCIAGKSCRLRSASLSQHTTVRLPRYKNLCARTYSA